MEDHRKSVTEGVWNGDSVEDIKFKNRGEAYDELDLCCEVCNMAFRKGSGYEAGDDCPACGSEGGLVEYYN